MGEGFRFEKLGGRLSKYLRSPPPLGDCRVKLTGGPPAVIVAGSGFPHPELAIAGAKMLEIEFSAIVRAAELRSGCFILESPADVEDQD